MDDEDDAAGGPEGATTRAEWAYAALERVILTGELIPGQRLNEPALAKQLGVSRGPLREAIQRLEGRKLIKRVPHLGATVVELSPHDLQEIFFLREVLEGLACRLATENLADAELDVLDRLLARAQSELDSSLEEAQSALAGDPDFHFVIINGSLNSRLIDLLLGELYPLMQVYRFRSRRSSGRVRQALAEHSAILTAMRARDADRAEALMRTHIRNARLNIANGERRAANSVGEPNLAYQIRGA
jgi:DNA-binding GntR family transcriptional regulator